MSGKDWIRKKIWLLYLHPTPFVLIIFNVSSWLIQGNNMSKKGYSRIPWLFLRVSLIFFPAARVSSGSNKKHGLHSCQLLCLVIGIMPYLVLMWSLAELPHIMSPQEFCAHGSLTNAICSWCGMEQQGACMLYLSPLLMPMLHCLMGFHLENPSSKV